MRFGLKDEYIRLLQRYFDFDENVDTAWIYGSRAKGTYKNTSDIDFAVKIRDHLELGGIIERLLALPIPYKIDVVDYELISSKNFKDEIDKTGIIFYKRPGTFKRIFLILIDAFKKKFNLVKKAN